MGIENSKQVNNENNKKIQKFLKTAGYLETASPLTDKEREILNNCERKFSTRIKVPLAAAKILLAAVVGLVFYFLVNNIWVFLIWLGFLPVAILSSRTRHELYAYDKIVCLEGPINVLIQPVGKISLEEYYIDGIKMEMDYTSLPVDYERKENKKYRAEGMIFLKNTGKVKPEKWDFFFIPLQIGS